MDRDIGTLQLSPERNFEFPPLPDKKTVEDDKQRWQTWMNYIQKETLEFQSKYAFYMK